jgi:hypothetical protein
MADLEELTGIAFDMEAYRRVSQYIYMGALDTNDVTEFRDAYSDTQAELIWSLFGREMPRRWATSCSVYESLGIPVQMVTYNGTGHSIRPEMLDDIVEFFRANTGEEQREIEPHSYPKAAPNLLEVAHVSGAYWQGDARIPEEQRDLFDGKGSFILAIEEWDDARDHHQLDDFRKKAGFHFVLEAEGRPSVVVSARDSCGTCSSGDGAFQGFVVCLGPSKEAMIEPSDGYRLAAIGSSGSWVVREGVRLRRLVQ